MGIRPCHVSHVSTKWSCDSTQNHGAIAQRAYHKSVAFTMPSRQNENTRNRRPTTTTTTICKSTHAERDRPYEDYRDSSSLAMARKTTTRKCTTCKQQAVVIVHQGQTATAAAAVAAVAAYGSAACDAELRMHTSEHACRCRQ